MNKFHFIKNKNVTLGIIAAVLLIGIVSFIVRGFNIDIDFSGGTEIQIDLGTEVTQEVIDNVNNIIATNEKLGQNYVSSTTQSTTVATTAIIRTGTSALTVEQQAALQDALVEAYPKADVKNAETQVIAPTIGKAYTKSAIIAVLVGVVLMLVYIWFRFELASGLAAVVSLAHDLFVMMVVYSILQIPVSSNIIIALLTILGYSINATIIVFDRVRENKQKDGENKDFADIVDTGIKQTLGRSVNTTITTLLTIGMIFILGGDAIRDFSLPLIVGIIAGLFSSVFMSGMLWNAFSKVIKSKKA